MQAAVELSPEEGHLKYLYLGQMREGEEAVSYLSKGIEIMTRELHTQQSEVLHAMYITVTTVDGYSMTCAINISQTQSLFGARNHQW